MSKSKLEEIAELLEQLARQEAEDANDSYRFGYANGLKMAARILKEATNDGK